ncbi:MAG: NAD(P)/FAD-dependent oxidoreductase [Acidobacteria bacterium]|nr:NAD(P)/FAD-dependent oxidoreductase [Acidobacteriota bacterium]
MEGRYETAIVGGGPAGLTAAIHLAWHQRKVVVMDRRSGPLFFTLEGLHNVPGVPVVRGLDLQKKLMAQAKELEVEIVRTNVVSASGTAGEFLLEGESGDRWLADTVLLATGVARYHPTIDGDFRPCFKYAGKGNLFYCPDCEAPEIRDKKTLVIGVGSANDAAGMAIGLSRYTDDLSILLTGDVAMSRERAEQLETKGITVAAGDIVEMIGSGRRLAGLRVRGRDQGERRFDAEAFFVSSPARGRTDLAQQLGVEMAATQNHAQPRSQRGDTNIEGVWIAGDLRPMTQQVAVAMGTGNIAAVMIDQTLRRKEVLPGS